MFAEETENEGEAYAIHQARSAKSSRLTSGTIGRRESHQAPQIDLLLGSYQVAGTFPPRPMDLFMSNLSQPGLSRSLRRKAMARVAGMGSVPSFGFLIPDHLSVPARLPRSACWSIVKPKAAIYMYIFSSMIAADYQCIVKWAGLNEVDSRILDCKVEY